jgi:hypothetical protein
LENVVTEAPPECRKPAGGRRARDMVEESVRRVDHPDWG